MRKWKFIGIGAVFLIIVFVFSFGESDRPLLNQPFVVQNWSNKIITLVNGSASSDSLMVHDDTGNGVRRIAPMATHLAPYALSSSVPAQFNLISGTGIGQSGTYPNITVNNTAPDQTVSVTANNGLVWSGTYPTFTLTKKRQETYTGTTSGAGTYTVTYSTPYSVEPNVIISQRGGTPTNTLVLSASSTTGFTVTANNRVEVLGLLPTYPTLNGAVVNVIVTEK